jgi:hypothetical protein
MWGTAPQECGHAKSVVSQGRGPAEGTTPQGPCSVTVSSAEIYAAMALVPRPHAEKACAGAATNTGR